MERRSQSADPHAHRQRRGCHQGRVQAPPACEVAEQVEAQHEAAPALDPATAGGGVGAGGLAAAADAAADAVAETNWGPVIAVHQAVAAEALLDSGREGLVGEGVCREARAGQLPRPPAQAPWRIRPIWSAS